MTMLEHCGGEPAVRALIEAFHASLLEDPLIAPLFEGASKEHAQNLTAYVVEMMGGEQVYSEKLGAFRKLLNCHVGLCITQEQADRFTALMLEAADKIGLPRDERFQHALAYNVARGAGFASELSHPDSRVIPEPYPPLGTWEW